MAKAKKISVNAFEKAGKERCSNTFEAKWHDLDITFTYTIGLEDVLSIIEEVSSNCFLSDGTFVPGVMMPLLYGAVISKYTNISLPANLSSRYDLIARSGIMEFIMDNINVDQFNQIVDAIERKVDYLCDSNTAEFSRAVAEMTVSLGDMKARTEELMSSISSADITQILSFISDEGDVEKKAADKYLKLISKDADYDGDQ